MEGSLFTKENIVFKILLDHHGNIFTFWRFNLYTLFEQLSRTQSKKLWCATPFDAKQFFKMSSLIRKSFYILSIDCES